MDGLLQALAKDIPWKLKDSRVVEILEAVGRPCHIFSSFPSPYEGVESHISCRISFPWSSFLLANSVLLLFLRHDMHLTSRYINFDIPSLVHLLYVIIYLLDADWQQHRWACGFHRVCRGNSACAPIGGTWLWEVAAAVACSFWEIRHRQRWVYNSRWT